MAKAPPISLTGDRALIATISELPKAWYKKGVSNTMKDAQKQVVLPDARASVAKGKTGKLKKSLKVRAARGFNNKRLPRGVFGWAVTIAKTTKLDAYYGKWVLLDRKLRDGTFRRGDRTLRNSLYQNSRRIRNYVVYNFKKTLNETVTVLRAKNKAKK